MKSRRNAFNSDDEHMLMETHASKIKMLGGFSIVLKRLLCMQYNIGERAYSFVWCIFLYSAMIITAVYLWKTDNCEVLFFCRSIRGKWGKEDSLYKNKINENLCAKLKILHYKNKITVCNTQLERERVYEKGIKYMNFLLKLTTLIYFGLMCI